MDAKLNELKDLWRTYSDLTGAAALLHWDQATQMPPGGAPARARQLATLQRLAHETLTDERLGRVLDDLGVYANDLPEDSDDARLIRVARRDYEKATRLPAALVAEMSEHAANAFAAWAKARPQNDFDAVAPLLEQTLELSRRYAEHFEHEHIMDPLIDESDPGMTVAQIQPLFAQLRRALVPLVEAIAEQAPADDACLHRRYPEAQQRAFGESIIKRFGYDFERGRQDKTHHPFMIKFSLGDVRITTRFNEDNLAEGLFSTMHEAGHAMYEQGIDRAFEATPLARGTSSGVHESQSRLWENLVGRSLGFWKHFYPELQAQFPDQLGDTALETFYRAVNKVGRSLIRTDADELTYNLHVLVRFELELRLLEGKLRVRDLPEAWNEAYRDTVGVAPPDHKDGVLQDVHWFAGTVGGAFQGYTLGNVMSAQIYEAALQAHPDIPSEIERGQFGTLHGWLRDNVYAHGRKYAADELIQRVTGAPLSVEPYLRYLKEKFGGLYELG